MSFNAEPSRVPAGIGWTCITLKDRDGTQPGRSINFKMQILDAAGEMIGVREGDLRPHLTGQQLSALSDFLDAMRTKAVAEILPH